MIDPANPLLSCHECGTGERFITMKRSDDRSLKYLDVETGEQADLSRGEWC